MPTFFIAGEVSARAINLGVYVVRELELELELETLFGRAF